MATAHARVPRPLAAAETSPDSATGAGPHRGWLAYLPAGAGIGYLVAWVTGLAVWPSNLALTATSAQVAASYRAHSAAAATQYLLVEGLAGLLFGTVLAVALFSAARRQHAADQNAADRGAADRGAIVLAAGAVLISLTQCVLGLILVGAASAHDAARAGDLFGLVNRLDGVKMLALAGVAVYLAVTGRRQLPRWIKAVAALAALALVVSGLSYLALASALAGAVYVSGPLLLLWIAATGSWLTRAARPARRHVREQLPA
jgi:hypothetical protein